LRFDDVF
jgi:hypothetical protein